MKTLSGRQEPETPRSSLDTMSTTARKRFKRMYHRVRSGLIKKGRVRLLTLTTSDESQNKAFQKHFRMFRMRLLRRGLLVDYIRCPEYTKSGLRHEHILFRGSYIEQAFISHLWNKIHSAPVVDITAVRGEHRIARYLASYLAKSPAGRYSYSWGWVWKGFARSWKVLKRVAREGQWSFEKLLTKWRICVLMDIRPEEFWIRVGCEVIQG